MAKGGYRPSAGRKPGIKETKPRAKRRVKGEPKPEREEQPEIPKDITDEAAAENLTPLAYMLKVMNDPEEKDNIRKDRMAIAAAPFCHARAGEGKGKKEEKADAAKQAGAGRFAAGAPPTQLQRVK